MPFKNERDFRDKIDDDKEFRIKVQKLVYLSKFFGWDNSYHFNFHVNGPFSRALREDYNNEDLALVNPIPISSMRLDEFREFIKDNDIGLLEAESTLLYIFNKIDVKGLTKKDSLDILKSLKPYLPRNIVFQAFDNILNFNLFQQNVFAEDIEDIKKYENIVLDKYKGLMDIYERFDVSSNRLFILGSLDYFRIVLNKEKLDYCRKKELLTKFYKYAEEIEIHYFENHASLDDFANLDLSNLKSLFNELEDYVSYELMIIPKFDENSDLKMFF